MVSVVVRKLGTIPKWLAFCIALFYTSLTKETIQKTTILGTSLILRKVLEMESTSGVPRL